MRILRESLASKALAAIIVVLLPILITFSVIYLKNSAYLKQRVLDTLTVIADAYEGQVYQFLEMFKQRTQDFSSDGFIKYQLQKIIYGNQYAVKALNKYLINNKIALDKSIHTINIISLDGRVVASTDNADIGKDVSGKAYFRKGRESLTLLENHAGNKEFSEITVSAPIFTGDTGRPIGVIVNFINSTEIYNLLLGKYARRLGAISSGTGQGSWKTLALYLVNDEKRMITEPTYSKDAVINQTVDTLPVQRALTAGEETAAFYKDYRGVEVVGASMYIPSMKWVILVEIDKAEVFAPIRTVFIGIVIMATVVVAMIAFLFIAFLWRVVKPLHAISDAMKDIAAGNFDIVVPAPGSDEIGVLGKSFAYMVRHLKSKSSALMDSKVRLAEAQKISHIGNWEWIIVTNELHLSDEIYNIFGLSPRESGVTFEKLLSCVHPDDKDLVNKALNDALNNKRPFEIEHRLLLKDKTVRIVYERATVVRIGDGKVIRMMGTVQDVTEWRLREEALHKNEHMVQSIFDNSTAVIYVKDVQGRHILVNRQFEMLFHVKNDEIKGRSNHDLWPTEVADALRANDRKIIETKTSMEFEECVVIDEVPHTYLSVKFPLFDSRGNVYAVCGISTDITGQKKAEAEKATLKEHLYHAQKMETIGRLAGGIAHDFNNFLMVITGYGNLIQMEEKDIGAIHNYTKILLDASERAAQLTQGLLTFSRKHVIQSMPVPLNDVIKRMERLLLRLLSEDIKLVTALTENGCVVLGDGGQIEQMLMNLTANAKDAMPHGGVLTIETNVENPDGETAGRHGLEEDASYIVLSVSDTGVGMDEETRKRVFEPFFTTKASGKGTGLGLSIVYGIVQQHRGGIDVLSEPGRGTTVKIYLPREESDVEEIVPDNLPATAGGTEMLLLAEDDSAVRGVVRMICERAGYKIIEATNGKEAISKFKTNNGDISLFVSDVMMPGMNGKEAYDVMRAMRPDMKAVFMSGYAEDVINNKILLDEKLHFVSKPVVPRMFLRKIREVLDGKV